jgi:Protein of unknown function (DUF3224)
MTHTYVDGMELSTRLEIKNWDEKPYDELPGGEKFARASVSTVGTEGFAGESVSEMLLYYRPDGTSAFVGLQRFAGRLADRDGTFVIQTDGSYDGTTARVSGRVVPGSGTGELTGISGELTSASTHADYPWMPLTLRYELE